MSAPQVPCRATVTTLRPVATITDPARPEFAVLTILGGIRRILRAGKGPAHLFVEADGSAYLLHVEHTNLPVWLRERFDVFVGCYARVKRKGQPALTPTIDGLCEDITEHLATLNTESTLAG